jgi:glycosyltransferase involved in cell wall biosynthesis
MRAAEHWVSVLGRTDIHCLFLGNRTEEVRGFRSEYDLAAPYITFGGYQSDIPELLSGCTIGCVPSTGWDSFPMSSLEMQSCGLPVAVSDLQGVPETVVDQLTGIVTPAGDHVALARALVELIDDPIRRSEMSMMARRRVEEGYTCDRQVESLEGLLRSVAG